MHAAGSRGRAHGDRPQWRARRAVRCGTQPVCLGEVACFRPLCRTNPAPLAIAPAEVPGSDCRVPEAADGSDHDREVTHG